MDLKDALIGTPQREIAGARSASLFDFQKNWAFLLLLDYHRRGRDYVFAFDFHDDILCLDSHSNPKQIELIQVKTRTDGSSWTVANLTTRKKGKGDSLKNSIIGKLFINRANFKDFDCILRFVTNAYFKFIPAIEEKRSGDKLKAEDQDAITKSMKAELGLFEKEFLSVLILERTGLSPAHHEKTLIGELHDFFTEQFGSEHSVAVRGFYETVAGEIRRKNNYYKGTYDSFPELLAKKCLTREQFQELLDEVKRARTVLKEFPLVSQILKEHGYNGAEVLKIGRAWDRFSVERLNYGSAALHHVFTEIKKIIGAIGSDDLHVLTSSCEASIKKKYPEFLASNGNHYLLAMVMWGYCESISI